MGRTAPFCISDTGLPTASWSASARCSYITWISLSSRATVVSIERANQANQRLVEIAGEVVGPEHEEGTWSIHVVQSSRARRRQLEGGTSLVFRAVSELDFECDELRRRKPVGVAQRILTPTGEN